MRTRPVHQALQSKLAVLLLAVTLAACSGGAAEEPAAADDAVVEAGAGAEAEQEPVTLTVGLFGDFGYEALYEEYSELNPHVTIEETSAELVAHHDSLTTAFAAGSGAPDIAAVEIGFLAQFMEFPENFHNVQELGADEAVLGRYLDFKVEQVTTLDGAQTIGLPTDIGGMALCYRRDLFSEAGLPTDREEVAEMISDWDAFIEAGQTLREETGAAMANNAAIIWDAVLGQADETFYDADGNLVYADSPGVAEAWDVAVRSIDAGITGNITAFSPEWNAGMTNGDYATLTCPAWMMGYIQGQAPDTSGLWDIADLPAGGGNWGGSWLTLPAQGEHPEEAYAFIEWLLAPEQQLQVFVENGNFPTIPQLYDSEEIQSFENPFFNDAPVGPIYADNAREIVSQPLGPSVNAIELAFEDGLTRVENGEQVPEDAWNQAVETIQRDIVD